MPFDEAELDFARRFASAVAMALRTRPSTHQSITSQRRSKQRSSIWIPPTPQLAVGHLYRSATLATRVGGDFYDVFPMADGLVGVVIGDVSGKGLGAAVQTSFVKNTIRALAHFGDVAGHDRGAERTRCWHRQRGLPDFATVVLIVVDSQARRVTYCSAGHPPSIVCRAHGSTVPLECGSPVIGAFVGLEYTENSFELSEGDVVVLYTDGVTEARSPGGDFFGEERLLGAIEKAAHRNRRGQCARTREPGGHGLHRRSAQ